MTSMGVAKIFLVIYQSNNLAPAGDALTNVTQGVVDMGADKQQKKAEDIDGNFCTDIRQ